MNTLNQPSDTKPWYKQFWPWVLIFLPLSAVVAGLSTVYIANHGADTPVKKDYYQAGIRINQRKHLIENAARLGIQTDLAYNHADQKITLSLNGPQQNVKTLRMVLRHPAYEPLDRSFDLLPIGNQQYQHNLEIPMFGKWYITITDNDRSWLLEDQIQIEETTLLTITPSRQ